MKSIFRKIFPVNKNRRKSFYFYMNLYRTEHIDREQEREIEEYLDIKGLSNLKSSYKDVSEEELMNRFAQEYGFTKEFIKYALIPLEIDLKNKDVYIDFIGEVSFK